MTTTWRAVITDIPVKIFTENILPFCKVKDVLSLCCTSKFFALIMTDGMFWKRKAIVDYNFTGPETAKTSRWKFSYQKLRNPRVFVWGCVTFSFFHRSAHVCSFNHNRSERRTKANSGYRGFQRRPSGMFLFQSNFASQVFVWSVWRRVKGQYGSHS